MLNEVFKLYAIPTLPEDWPSILTNDVMPILGVVVFAVLLILEIIPVRHKRFKKILFRSYQTNISTFLFNSIILSLLSVSSLLLLAEQYHHNGILSMYDQPIQFVLAFILFDLTLYIWHWANHHYDALWIFHKAHHSDKTMNVSTAFRIHFVEVLLTTLVKALFVMAAGVDTEVVVLCEAVSMLFAMFHHLNFSFRIEKWLKWVIIVPAMHRIHHSSLRKEHDSNYGAIFSIWDHLFRTASDIQTGKIGLPNTKALNFFELLHFGMMPVAIVQPEVVNQHSVSTVNQGGNMDAMIAEAAYYIAEKRGFTPGRDLFDWLEAEQYVKESIQPSMG